jgi:hypothetical protein
MIPIGGMARGKEDVEEEIPHPLWGDPADIPYTYTLVAILLREIPLGPRDVQRKSTLPTEQLAAINFIF